MNNTFSV